MTWGDLYPWIKAGHVIAVLLFVSGVVMSALIAWAPGGGEGRPGVGMLRLARRWDTGVTTAAMLGAWGFGLVLATMGGWFASRWLVAKLVVVVVLSGVHGVLSARLRVAAGGRLVGGVGWAPGVVIALVGVIVVLVVVKPI